MMGHVFPRFSIRNAPRRSPAHAGRSRVGDLENGGRLTVKKYQSVKRVTEDEWSHEHIELLPLNRDYSPIIVTPHEAPQRAATLRFAAANEFPTHHASLTLSPQSSSLAKSYSSSSIP